MKPGGAPAAARGAEREKDRSAWRAPAQLPSSTTAAMADRAPISHFDVSLCGFHGDVVAVLPLKRKRRADEPSGQQHSAGWRHGLNSFTLRLSCACSPTSHRHGNQLPDPIQGILDLDVDL
ncbi:unnamed protein product [Boreogadus saida]